MAVYDTSEFDNVVLSGPLPKTFEESEAMKKMTPKELATYEAKKDLQTEPKKKGPSENLTIAQQNMNIENKIYPIKIILIILIIIIGIILVLLVLFYLETQDEIKTLENKINNLNTQNTV